MIRINLKIAINMIMIMMMMIMMWAFYIDDTHQRSFLIGYYLIIMTIIITIVILAHTRILPNNTDTIITT